MKQYILNKETSKIELHFSKEEYNNLSDEDKKSLKGAYLFSGKSQAWVSRSKNNHYYAIQVAEKLGFEEGETVGKKLTFEEELERQKEKAEYKQEKYLNYSESASKRAETLQAEFNHFRGDTAFMTQPIIRGHRGSETFARRRENILNRYGKGFEEYRKSKYFIDKAESMDDIINGEKFKDRQYLVNRIEECNKKIKAQEKNIVYYEEKNMLDKIDNCIEQIEYEIDKLAYMENCLDKLGKNFSKENLQIGYEVKIRGDWGTILKLNQKTVEVQPLEERLKMFISKRDYKEIEEIRIPKNLNVKEVENPFKIGDIFTFNSYVGGRILNAYKVVKTTNKTVTIKELQLENNKIIDEFKLGSKELRRQVKKSKYNDTLYIANGDYMLHQYTSA